MHRRYNHWGSKGLRERVARTRPRVHIFGHVHNSHGCSDSDGTLFINAAQDLNVQPVFFDAIVRETAETVAVAVADRAHSHHSRH